MFLYVVSIQFRADLSHGSQKYLITLFITMKLAIENKCIALSAENNQKLPLALAHTTYNEVYEMTECNEIAINSDVFHNPAG